MAFRAPQALRPNMQEGWESRPPGSPPLSTSCATSLMLRMYEKTLEQKQKPRKPWATLGS
eukprot:3345010-Amphidinium_carterae.2